MDHNPLNPKEVEDAVIGQVLYEPSVITRAVRYLKPEHFYGDEHRAIYTVAMDLWRDGTPVDLLTVHHELKKVHGGKFADAYMLSEMMRRVSQTTHFEAHAQVIRDQYSLRTLAATGSRLQSSVNVTADVTELITDLNEDIAKASSADMDQDVNAGDRGFSMLNETRPKAHYLNMGPLDDYVFLLPGNMVTVSGPSGIGKTAFVLSAVVNLLPTFKTWFVSLEMPADELLTRTLCQLAEVDIASALRDKLDDGEKMRMSRAAIDHNEVLNRLSIDDTGYMTSDSFKAKAEHKVKNEGVGLIVVDYAQLMDASIKKGEGVARENEAISKTIRAVTRSLNIITLCVVHINNAGESHGSGQYDKDAHVRLKLSKQDGDNHMKVGIPKNRNGRTGSCEVPCDLRFGLIGRTGSSVSTAPRPDMFHEPIKEDAPF